MLEDTITILKDNLLIINIAKESNWKRMIRLILIKCYGNSSVPVEDFDKVFMIEEKFAEPMLSTNAIQSPHPTVIPTK